MNDVTVQLVKGKGLQPWYLRMVATNGEILFFSEGYYSKFNAKRAAKKLVNSNTGWRFKDTTLKPYKKNW